MVDFLHKSSNKKWNRPWYHVHFVVELNKPLWYFLHYLASNWGSKAAPPFVSVATSPTYLSGSWNPKRNCCDGYRYSRLENLVVVVVVVTVAVPNLVLLLLSNSNLSNFCGSSWKISTCSRPIRRMLNYYGVHGH